MSKLFGPISVTNSRVSCRDCALAGEKTAGAGRALAAAMAVTDFRNSRRFMGASRRHPGWKLGRLPQSSCQGGVSTLTRLKLFRYIGIWQIRRGPTQSEPLHTRATVCLKIG